MDEKTEELRDIFMEVAEDGTVTEHQEDTRGSLVGEEGDEERVREVIDRMRERYDFRSSLAPEALVEVVYGFFAEESDAEIARRLGEDTGARTVRRARVDLHLVTDRDLDAPFDLDELRNHLEADRSTGEVADALGVSASTVRRYRQVVRVQDERRVVGDRFRTEFERILGDAELSTRMTEEARQDGLEEATEGMETDVSF